MEDNNNIPQYGLPQHPPKMPYEVPVGYFEQLPSTVLSILKETVVLPKVAVPYTAPDGYFEALPAVLNAKVKGGSDNLYGQRVIWWQWAAAAIIVFTIGVGAFLMSDSPKLSEADRLLYAVTPGMLNDYVALTDENDIIVLPATVRLEHLDVKPDDIEAYLNETGCDLF